MMLFLVKHIGLVLLLLIAGAGAGFATSPCDEFDYKNAERSIANIESCLISLRDYPAGVGYVIIYGSRYGKLGEVEAHMGQMRHYIEKVRGFDGTRISFVNGGFRDKVTIVFWIVPPGAAYPKPTPFYKQDEVKLKGTFTRRSLYLCC